MVGVPVEALTSDYRVSYIPSGTYLARLRDRAPPAGKGLLQPWEIRSLRDRAADGRSFPARACELTQISKLFAGESKQLFDSAASEQSLEVLRKQDDLSKFRYLHFATHGEANNVRALESVLISGPRQTSQGFPAARR